MERTIGERRAAVRALLSKPEWRGRSVWSIARAAGVSRELVRKVAEEMGITWDTTREYVRGGVTTTMDTAKIGKRPRLVKLARALVRLKRLLAHYREFPELKPIREAVRQVRAETRKRRKGS